MQALWSRNADLKDNSTAKESMAQSYGCWCNRQPNFEHRSRLRSVSKTCTISSYPFWFPLIRFFVLFYLTSKIYENTKLKKTARITIASNQHCASAEIKWCYNGGVLHTKTNVSFTPFLSRSHSKYCLDQRLLKIISGIWHVFRFHVFFCWHEIR